MLDLDTIGWLVVGLSAFTVGASKTGIPGAGILVVPLMAMVFPDEETKKSVGVLLGLLILGDLFAAAYHRRNAQWGHVLRLLPATVAGIVGGWQAMRFVSNELLEPIIGGIVLLPMVACFFVPSTTGRVMLFVPVVVAMAERLGFSENSPGRKGMITAATLGCFAPSCAVLPANV